MHWGYYYYFLNAVKILYLLCIFLVSEHYSGNKYRNAQVREDLPCAREEQLREQRLAEQAAALYHQMILEQ